MNKIQCNPLPRSLQHSSPGDALEIVNEQENSCTVYIDAGLIEMSTDRLAFITEECAAFASSISISLEDSAEYIFPHGFKYVDEPTPDGNSYSALKVIIRKK